MASLPPHGRPGAVKGVLLMTEPNGEPVGFAPPKETGAPNSEIPKSCFVSCVFHKWGYPIKWMVYK